MTCFLVNKYKKYKNSVSGAMSKSPYVSEAPYTSYIPPFVLGLIVYALNDWLFKKLVDFVYPALQHFSPDWIISSACVGSFIIGLIITVYKLSEKREPTLLSIWYCIIILSIYFVVVRPNPYAIFFRCFGWNHIYISDLLLLSSILFTISYVYIDKPLEVNSAIALLEDIPHNMSQQNDSLSRYSYAGYISDVIKATVSEKAMAISVLSDWGYGKTSFLNSIKDRLTNKNVSGNQSNIVVEFNPWKFEKSGQLLSHFFDELEATFRPYDDQVAAGLRDYADKLTEAEDPSLIKITTQSISRVFGSSKSLSDRYDNLNKAILRSGKRLIIIIDDMDRLMPDELVTMIRLIRNTADFTNTFFIAAFDQRYVINALTSTGNIVNQENYLQKIFQLEISLPPIDRKIISTSLREYLYKGMSPDTIALFEEVISSVDEPQNKLVNFFKKREDVDVIIKKINVSDYLDNIREVKRFVNSFRITYSIIGNEVNLYDLLTLELIKYRFPIIYNQLSNQKLIDDVYGNRTIWSFNTKHFDVLFDNHEMKLLNVLQAQKELIRRTLEMLFDNNGKRGSRSILFQDTFHLYFHYQLFDSISIHELEQARLHGKDTLDLYFQKTAEDNKIEELVSYIERITAYRNKQDFENMVSSIFMLVSNHNAPNNLLHKLFENSAVNVEAYYGKDKRLYENFLMLLFQDIQYKAIIRADSAGFFLISHARKELNLFFNKSALSEVLLNILSYSIEENPNNVDEIFSIYQRNWESKEDETDRIIIAKEANTIMKKYLYKYYPVNKLFQKPFGSYNENYLEVYPFVIQIFDDYNDFRIFLEKNPNSTCQEFLLNLFDRFDKNSFKPIESEGFFSKNPCLKSGTSNNK